MLSVFRHRDFLLLWSGQAVSTLGSRISATAYPLLVLSMTGSPAIAGWIGFLAGLPFVLFQIPAGLIADRFDRRRVMIGCELVRGIALASLAVSLAQGRLGLAQVALVAIVESTMFVVFRLGEVAAVRHVVPATVLSRALGQNEARIRGAYLLEPPLGGLLFGLSRALPFLADALTYVVSFGTLLAIRTRLQSPREPGQGRLGSEIVEGARWLWRQPFVRDSLLLAAASNVAFQALVLVVIVRVREQGGSPALIGLVLGAASLGGLFGALLGPAIQSRISPRIVVVGAVTSWAVTVGAMAMAMAMTRSPLLVGSLYACSGFVGGVWNVAVSLFYLRTIPDRLLARVLSIGSLLSFGALPLGWLLSGQLLQGFGSDRATAALALWMLALAVAGLLSRAIRGTAAYPEATGS